MSSPTTRPLVSDPWEMALIHRLIRRGFEQSGEFVVAPGAGSRTGAVAEYVGFHLHGLEAHHSSEDELLWPVLHEPASLSDALVLRMEEQHAGLRDAIDTTRHELQAWVVAPTATGSESLASAINALLDGLAEHLAEEERDIVPLIAIHITQSEWEHLGKVAFNKFTPKQRFTAMGEMLAAASPTEAARMLAGLPAPIKLVWRLFGRRRYERSIAKARG